MFVLGVVFVSRLMVSLNPRGNSPSCTPCADTDNMCYFFSIFLSFCLFFFFFLRWRMFFNLLVWLNPLAVCFFFFFFVILCCLLVVRLSSAGREGAGHICPNWPCEASFLRRLLLTSDKNNGRLSLICALIWYICTALVHILKMSDSVKRIKSPFQRLPVAFFFFFLMIKTWAPAALIKRLGRFLPPQVQSPAIERD